jgi:hypothetical protein
MALSFFQQAEPTFLRENGSLVDAAGQPVAANAVRTLALSRALCRFHSFRAPPGLSSGQVVQAARLAAETNAPFSPSGSLILRTEGGASIWYWDGARVAELFGTRAVNVAPESVFSAAHDGWRIVESLDGYEAQYWQNGALQASTWRRRPLDAAQWTLFVQGVENADTPAPATPPTPEKPAFDASGAWRRQQVKPPLSWADAEKAAAGVAFCAAGVAAFLVGQSLRLDGDARRDTARAAEISQVLSADENARRAEAQLALIQNYQTAMAAPDVLNAAADALEVLHRLDLQVGDWSVDGETLRLVLVQTASEIEVRDLVAALEAAPALENVEPQFRGRDQGLEINATLAQGRAR